MRGIQQLIVPHAVPCSASHLDQLCLLFLLLLLATKSIYCLGPMKSFCIQETASSFENWLQRSYTKKGVWCLFLECNFCIPGLDAIALPWSNYSPQTPTWPSYPCFYSYKSFFVLQHAIFFSRNALQAQRNYKYQVYLLHTCPLVILLIFSSLYHTSIDYFCHFSSFSPLE